MTRYKLKKHLMDLRLGLPDDIKTADRSALAPSYLVFYPAPFLPCLSHDPRHLRILSFLGGLQTSREDIKPLLWQIPSKRQGGFVEPALLEFGQPARHYRCFGDLFFRMRHVAVETEMALWHP